MKTIGLLGGMSSESTVGYYQVINRKINQTLGGLHSAKIMLNSLDFAEITALQKQDKWDEAGTVLADAAVKLENSGADFVLICANTMHKVAPHIQQKISIPIVHIVDAVAEVLKADNVKKIGLLGTKFTMQEDFYKDMLLTKHNIQTIIPTESQCATVHQIIFSELCVGKIVEQSKQQYLAVIADLQKNGAEAIILGCTEIGMLISPSDLDIKTYDTMEIHALKAAELAMA